ncbi:hypothetical protein [Spirosoma endbachense]|uniref:Uncharacterized protein n=1 Tax=Spirosoma endbachense TaxID=2666025 RepID=A0A6P1VYW5_9BACT|nr:hypothetical protein [Spirosoma endbachense]QHV96596.1 hypothetical protein GJR95_16950 [Spirosoma endbachense]
MKTKDRQETSLTGEDRQSNSSDTKGRQRRSRKLTISRSYGSWAPLVLTLLFFVSLLLTYALIQPQPHTGLTGRILSMTPLFNNSPAFLFSLAIASLIGLMWLPSLEAYSTTKPAPLVGPTRTKARLVHTPERHPASSSLDVPHRPIQMISLDTSTIQDSLHQG